MGFPLELVVATMAVSIFGIGAFYLIWVKTRPKKLTYKAKIYSVSEGVLDTIKDKDGLIISTIPLHDLKPFMTDTIELIEKKGAGRIFRLQKLNKAVPPIEPKDIETFGKERYVNLLYDDGSCTVLRSGYNKKVGTVIFTPVGQSRMNMITSEMAIRKDRLQSNKDILEKIMPSIMIGIMVFGILGVAYFHGQAVIKSSEEQKKIADLNLQTQQIAATSSEKMLRASALIAEAITGKQIEIEKIINNNAQDNNLGPKKPEVIE